MKKSPISNIIYWTLNDSRVHPDWVQSHLEPDFLSPEENETYRGLFVPKRRDEWLLGRWTSKQLLRACDPGYADHSLKGILVRSEPEGAPYLFFGESGRYPGCLSISHRDKIAFCAISPSSMLRVGADIELVEPRATVFVHDFFTAREADGVLQYQGRTRDILVTLVWSMKESALKALGKGLRIDTRKVEITWDHDLADFGSEDALTPLYSFF